MHKILNTTQTVSVSKALGDTSGGVNPETANTHWRGETEIFFCCCGKETILEMGAT